MEMEAGTRGLDKLDLTAKSRIRFTTLFAVGPRQTKTPYGDFIQVGPAGVGPATKRIQAQIQFGFKFIAV
jgi:hypothetical protein